MVAAMPDFGDGKAESVEVGNIFESGVGEVAAGELAGALEEVADDGSLAEKIPVVERPAEFMDKRSEEERWIGDAGRRSR